MRELINRGIVYLGSFKQEDWLWIGFAGLILAYIFYNRKQYRNLFDLAVIASEESFNHGDNKKKLDAAIKYINLRTDKLPYLAKMVIRKFLSRKRMITIIEKTLQKFSDTFGNARKIDIEGNEENGEDTVKV